MESLIHADIFFFVTSIAVVVLAALGIVALVFLIRVLKDAGVVSRRIRKESEAIGRDIDELRSLVKAEGFKVRHLLSFFFRLTDKKRARTARKKKGEDDV